MRTVLFALLFAATVIAQTPSVIPPPPDVAAPPKDAKKTPSGLASKVIQPGTGKDHPASDELVTVNYTGWVYDPNKPDHKGSQFDTSVGRGPLSFTLGAGEVIQGWDQGFNDMRVGGKRQLIIPTDMGYGAQGSPDGSIPPNAPIMFEMELVDVK